MTTRLKALMNIAILLASVAVLSPAIAREKAPMGTVTKAGLEGQGYKCELVSVGFWECTKDGATTYWCDSGSCQPKPRVQQPGRRLPQVNLDTKLLIQ